MISLRVVWNGKAPNCSQYPSVAAGDTLTLGQIIDTVGEPRRESRHIVALPTLHERQLCLARQTPIDYGVLEDHILATAAREYSQ